MPKIAKFADVVGAVTDAAAKDIAHQVAQQFDARKAFEATERPHNLTIQAKLDKSRAKLIVPQAAAVLIAASVDPAFVNRSLSAGKRYNVYAIDKATDLVEGLRTGELHNAINRAICKSLFQFRAAKEPFTGLMAKAAASDKIKVTATLQKILVRHTVDQKTADTQASSTMNALETLGIVANKGTFKFPVYELTNSPQTNRLKEVLAA